MEMKKKKMMMMIDDSDFDFDDVMHDLLKGNRTAGMKFCYCDFKKNDVSMF
jgi:hypothetical protein